jgi:hypothetical protein
MAPLSEEQSLTSVEGRHGSEVVGHVLNRAESCIVGFALMIDPIRKVGRQLGYAIAVHGSLARDIDLVAIPWIDEAVDGQTLATAVFRIVQAFNKEVFVSMDEDCPRPKPHGRQCWSIHFWGSYIDLSVMPRVQA